MTRRSFAMLGFLAETFIHPGSGQMQDAIDLPVARESTTGYPFAPGSGLKGALSDVCDDESNKKFLFGTSDLGAGSLLVSDLRLLLLPVRSLDHVFRYVTSPHLLMRFLGDLKRMDVENAATREVFQKVSAKSQGLNGTHAAVMSDAGRRIFLEEYAYQPVTWAELLPSIAGLINHLLSEEGQRRADLAAKLTVVDDQSFAWFAENALPVRMRNSLNDNKQVKSGQLWSEEYLPPDTIMYALVGNRGHGANGEDPEALLADLLAEQQGYIQLGGNETLGQGWFEVRAWQDAAASAVETEG